MIAQKYKDRYYLNGLNLFNRWGIIIERGGYEELTKRAQRKEQYSRSWLDENGTQRYTGNILFNSRGIELPFTFLAKDLADYLEKSNAFFEYLFEQKGVVKLYSSTLMAEIPLLYNSVSSVNDKTEMYKSTGVVITTHNISFDIDSAVVWGKQEYNQDFSNDFNNDFLI